MRATAQRFLRQPPSLTIAFQHLHRRRRRRCQEFEHRVGILSCPSLLHSSPTLFAKTIPEAETIFSSAYDADRKLLVEPTAMVAFGETMKKKQKLLVSSTMSFFFALPNHSLTLSLQGSCCAWQTKREAQARERVEEARRIGLRETGQGGTARKKGDKKNSKPAFV